LVGRLTGSVQPRYLIAAGAAICAFAMYDMTKINGDLGFWFFATSRIYIGIGLPLVFLPIIAASYDGISPGKTDMASALINVARNTGGSVGIALANNVLAHREQFHQSRLVELVNPSTFQFHSTLKQATNYFVAQGSALAQAQQQAFNWIAQQVQTQAALLAYIDVFWALMLISVAAVPLALTLRKVKLGGPVPLAH
jgi:MFS transporter, DHA2 family, multidrug resistance protein